MAEEKITRKLTTILVADVEGYTRLMGADEEATLNTLSGYREVFDQLIVRHDGRVFNTGGDSVLAEFNSTVEAVRCAISIQEEISSRNAQLTDDRRLNFRIGINLGDVMVKDSDLFGAGVNLAARLEGLAPAGGVCISGSVYEQIKDKLSLGFEYMGEQTVKNITEPISAYRLLPGQTSASTATTAISKRRGARRWRMAAIATAVIAAIGAGGLWVWWPRLSGVEPASLERMAFPLPDKPSIAVLPFSNLSDDPSQDYFADGITDDLITDLSKNPGLFVIARNSTFTYKGRAVKVQRIAEELGVRYVLEGSVRRVGDQVRINSQLIDATTGGHLWADRFDGSLADVFVLQDKVTEQIVTALALELTPGARARRDSKQSLDPRAYDAFLKGWEHYRLDTPEHYARALQYFQQAAELDPDYDRAWAAMASIHWKSYKQDWAAVLGLGAYAARSKARELLAKGSGKPLPLAYQVASQIALWRGRFDEAIEAAEQAVGYDSSDADSQVALAEALIYGGEAEKALSLIEEARRQDPYNESRYAFLQGLARFVMDQFEAAATSFERTLELNPELWNPEGRLGRAYCYPCVALISAYGHLGRIGDAQVLIEKIKNEWAGYSLSTGRWRWPFEAGTDMDRFADGLIKAGVEE